MTAADEGALSLEDASVGDAAPELVVENVGREDFVQYAGASGDFNPIHYSEPVAIDAGNPGVFGQGMFTAGVLSTMVTNWIGIGTLTAFSTRFVERVWPGDTLVCSGEITAVDPDAGTVEAELRVETDDERTCITGTMAAKFPTASDD